MPGLGVGRDDGPGPPASRRHAPYGTTRAMSHVISVLIADDQALVREGLRTLLQAEPDITVAGEAGNGSEAIAAVGKTGNPKRL